MFNIDWNYTCTVGVVVLILIVVVGVLLSKLDNRSIHRK